MLMRDLRAKSPEELRKLIEDYKAELFLLRFRNSTGQLKETHKINDVRKEIAKVFTVINAKATTKAAAKPRRVNPLKKIKLSKIAPKAARSAKVAATKEAKPADAPTTKGDK